MGAPQNDTVTAYLWPEHEAHTVLTRWGALFRVDENTAPYLPDNKRNYIFGGLAAATAQFTIWLLPDIQVLLTATFLSSRSVSAKSSTLNMPSRHLQDEDWAGGC